MRYLNRSSLLTAFLVLFSAVAQAQSPKPMKEAKPGLLAKARISADAARKTAVDHVKGGSIKEEEIEEEGGRLVFSFDIKVPGKSGIEEVLVDAQSGAIVSAKHETPPDEAAEAAKDRRVKKPGLDRESRTS